MTDSSEINTELVREGGSYIASRKLAAEYSSDPSKPFLVSFPRTGSHWLRMMMEKYFERPTLRRVFFYPKNENYLCLHVHDMELDELRSNVLYLYRDPVDTVYSQLAYSADSFEDVSRITHWSELYAKHLQKWLTTETCTTHKTVIKYENLKNDLVGEFSKVTEHFHERLDCDRIIGIAKQISKDRVKEKTSHDPRVIARAENYSETRLKFKDQYGALVSKYVGPHLAP